MSAGTDMMAVRRAALDSLAALPLPAQAPFARFRVDLAEHLTQAEGVRVPASLARAVAALLIRDGADPGPGAAIVTGVAEYFDVENARVFHEELFRSVWEVFRCEGLQRPAPAGFKVKTGTISDGSIPLELYGSSWSFKQLHIDRDALLFSHLYGPVTGFGGGDLLLVDIRPYMAGRSLGFEDVFEWSDEATEGSKPVLRAEHHEAVCAEGGVVLPSVGPDQIVFVNNLPGAGILHGVTPVVVTDPGTFRREYHRCSAKELAPC
ncbi:hypothetical protein [Longispora albida]|uniref:hypothetical protein n=1 Tax=Longispora albida TaxID=203523 RepID=UPI000375B5E7|nr:hypothetical protein [Longispora albida]